MPFLHFIPVMLSLWQKYTTFFTLLSTGPLKLWGRGHGLVGLCLNPALPATAQSGTQLISKFRQTYSSTGYELQVRNTEEIEQLLVELKLQFSCSHILPGSTEALVR